MSSNSSFPNPGPRGAARAKLLRSRESDVGMPPSQRAMDLGAVSTSKHAEQALAELRGQNIFLEEQVRRLTEQLAKAQTQAYTAVSASKHKRPAQGGMTKASFLEGMAEGAPLPPWLTDAQYLSPLLIAYDESIADQERKLVEQHEALDQMRVKVEQVVQENDRLLGDLDHHMSLLSSRADASMVGVPEEHLELMDRIELLTRENNLLMLHQQDQHKAIEQAKLEAEERTQEVLALQREMSLSVGSRQGTAQELYDLDCVCNELQVEVKNLAAKLVEKEKFLTKTTNEAREKSDLVGILETARDHLQTELHTLQTEFSAVVEREGAANNLNISLQRDLDQARGQLSTVQEDLHNVRREAMDMQQAMVALENRLSEYNKKDIEVFQRIKVAKMNADQATVARDQVLERQSALEKEVSELQQKLASAHQRHQAELAQELEAIHARTKAEHDSLVQEARVHETSKNEMEARHDRAVRDHKSAEARIQVLEAAVRAHGPVDPDTELRLMEAERSRDIAEERAASNQRAAQLAAQEWERERVHLVSTAQEAEIHLQQVLASEKAIKKEAADLQTRCDSVERALRAARREKSSMESGLRKQCEDEARAHEAQMEVLARRLEAALASKQATRGEADELLQAKDSLMLKYKEEARANALKIEQVQTRFEHQLSAASERAEEAESQLAALLASTSNGREELQRLKELEKKWLPRTEAAEKRARDAIAQLKEVQRSEEQLLMARKELHSAVDRLALDKTRVERQRDTALQKAEAMRRQLDNMFSARPHSFTTAPTYQKAIVPYHHVLPVERKKKKKGKQREEEGPPRQKLTPDMINV